MPTHKLWSWNIIINNDDYAVTGDRRDFREKMILYSLVDL